MHRTGSSGSGNSAKRDRTLPLSGGSASCPVASAAESDFTDPGTLASTR
jgi:hypothetical protein